MCPQAWLRKVSQGKERMASCGGQYPTPRQDAVFKSLMGWGEGHGEGLPKKKYKDHPRTMAGSQHSMKFQQEEQ